MLAPPGTRKKIWGKKKSPLRVYVSPSLSLSQTYNKLCAPIAMGILLLLLGFWFKVGFTLVALVFRW